MNTLGTNMAWLMKKLEKKFLFYSCLTGVDGFNR